MGIVNNSLWLLAGQLVSLLSGLMVNVAYARQLHPELYGLYGYSVALTGLLGIWSGLGIKSILVREMAGNPGSEGSILRTSFIMLSLSGALAFLIVVPVLYLIPGNSRATIAIGTIHALTFLLQGSVIFVTWMEAHSRFRTLVSCQAASTLAFSAARVILLRSGAGLEVLVSVNVIQCLIDFFVLFLAFRKNAGKTAHLAILGLFDRVLAFRILREGFPILISGIVVTLYMRVDQIMLGLMIDTVQVGYYSAAVKISESMYLIPASIATAFYPVLIRHRAEGESSYHRTMQEFFDLMALIGLVSAILVISLSRVTILTLFGAAFLPSAEILSLHAIGGLFVSMGISCKYWFILEHKQIYTFYRTLAGCILNIILNFILIPEMGARGAAFATVAAQALSLFIFNYVNRNTRFLFRMQLRSLVPSRGIRAFIRLARRS